MKELNVKPCANGIKCHATFDETNNAIIIFNDVGLALGYVDVSDLKNKYRWHDLRKDPDDLPDKLEGGTGMEFYETVQENHEHDEVRASYQFEEEIGWGWWSDIYDPVTLGFVDTEFHELEEEGYEKVIAWREIEPFESEVE